MREYNQEGWNRKYGFWKKGKVGNVVYDVEKVERVATASDNVYCAIVVARFSCDSYEEKEWSFKRYVYVVDENGELCISDFKTPGEKSDYEIMRKVLSVL